MTEEKKAFKGKNIMFTEYSPKLTEVHKASICFDGNLLEMFFKKQILKHNPTIRTRVSSCGLQNPISDHDILTVGSS